MQTLKSRLETVVHCFENDFLGFKIKSSKADAMKWLMRFNLPYTVREAEPGKYLLLNREYKPLGFMAEAGGHGAEHAVYEDHLLPGAPGLLENDIYFYNDASTPWGSAKNWTAYQKAVLTFLEKLPG
ncbi:hypothetical protein SME10J_50240 (plasmid) [Serratia marcescens]|nr:hypothetical protein SME10J_50240 [Serratia marcescens]